MQDRIAISLGSWRALCATVLIALAVTGGLFASELREPMPRQTRTSAVLFTAVRGEICAFALAMPACWHAMVCVDTLRWLIGAEAVVVQPPRAVVRARSVGMTPRYMLRERDVPPLALPR